MISTEISLYNLSIMLKFAPLIVPITIFTIFFHKKAWGALKASRLLIKEGIITLCRLALYTCQGACIYSFSLAKYLVVVISTPVFLYPFSYQWAAIAYNALTHVFDFAKKTASLIKNFLYWIGRSLTHTFTNSIQAIAAAPYNLTQRIAQLRLAQKLQHKKQQSSTTTPHTIEKKGNATPKPPIHIKKSHKEQRLSSLLFRLPSTLWATITGCIKIALFTCNILGKLTVLLAIRLPYHCLKISCQSIVKSIFIGLNFLQAIPKYLLLAIRATGHFISYTLPKKTFDLATSIGKAFTFDRIVFLLSSVQTMIIAHKIMTIWLNLGVSQHAAVICLPIIAPFLLLSVCKLNIDFISYIRKKAFNLPPFHARSIIITAQIACVWQVACFVTLFTCIINAIWNLLRYLPISASYLSDTYINDSPSNPERARRIAKRQETITFLQSVNQGRHDYTVTQQPNDGMQLDHEIHKLTSFINTAGNFASLRHNDNDLPFTGSIGWGNNLNLTPPIPMKRTVDRNLITETLQQKDTWACSDSLLKNLAPNVKEKLSSKPHLTCPITHDLIRYPIVCSDGVTYERDPLIKWLQEQSNESPTNRQEVTSLCENRLYLDLLKQAIADEGKSPAHNTTVVQKILI